MYSRSAGDAADPTGDENRKLTEALDRRFKQVRQQTMNELKASHDEDVED